MTIKMDLLTLSEFLDWPSAKPPEAEDLYRALLAFERVSAAMHEARAKLPPCAECGEPLSEQDVAEMTALCSPGCVDDHYPEETR